MAINHYCKALIGRTVYNPDLWAVNAFDVSLACRQHVFNMSDWRDSADL